MKKHVHELLKAIAAARVERKQGYPGHMTMSNIMAEIVAAAKELHDDGVLHYGPTMNDDYIKLK